MKEFDLENHDFIALNQLMKLLNWVESGGEANLRIDNGEVIVNQVVEIQRRKKLRKGDKIEFNDQIIVIK
jgi:ribosome-associated protein